MRVPQSKFILFSFFVLALTQSLGFTWPTNFSTAKTWVDQEVRLLSLGAPNIDSKVLRLSLTAYSKAQKMSLAGKPLLTVIDYSKPASSKRLWVFDLQHGKTLFNTWVSHGKNSGNGTATSFSNRPGSLKSSIGVFLTDTTYEGKNGYSLRLRGLERGINDNSYRRSIVVHGAWYVNPDIITRNGQIGRSWGCPAVSKNLSRPLINTIKDKTVIVAYYPDQNWLRSSRFLVS